MGISSQAIKMTLPAEHSLNTLQPGSIAPDFNCNGVGKQAARLRSLAGENLALVFANRDCPHCQAVLQELKHLCSSVRTQILVIMVDANQVGQEGDSCLRLVDATEQLFQAYGVVSVPTIYLLDAEQRVITVKSDFTDENPSKLAVELTSLLQQ
jgi:thiol-disulfide isomerase/thioredoxin